MGPHPNGCGRNPAIRQSGSPGNPDFNGAAPEWVRKALGLKDMNRDTIDFNGAAPEWVRKVLHARPAPVRSRATSMGPHPNGCGRDSPLLSMIENAMGLQWGRTRMGAEGMRPGCIGSGQFSLQWGRTRMGAEGRLSGDCLEKTLRTSMGPHPNGCGRLPFDRHPEIG